METSVKSDAAMYLLYQAIAEDQEWDDITEADFVEITGMEDNASLIETYGQGYLAKYVLGRRAVDYIMSQVKVEE